MRGEDFVSITGGRRILSNRLISARLVKNSTSNGLFPEDAFDLCAHVRQYATIRASTTEIFAIAFTPTSVGSVAMSLVSGVLVTVVSFSTCIAPGTSGTVSRALVFQRPCHARCTMSESEAEP